MIFTSSGIGRCLSARPGIVVVLCCAGLSIILAWMMLPFLALGSGGMGEDYALFLPNLLVGYFWFLRNGLGTLPWFTPAICGGFPFYADPNVPWFSVPQFLTFLFGPLAAVRITAIGFSSVGFAGVYVLLRRSFGLSIVSAVIAGALFMFNGFYISRMLIGHLSFHTFMLLPGVAACILPASRARQGWGEILVRLSLAAIGWSAMFEAGMIHAIPPGALAVVVIILFQAWRDGPQIRPFAYLFGAGLLAISLSATKLLAMVSLLSQLPRNMYPLPGISDLSALLATTFRAVFLTPAEGGSNALANTRILLAPHEWDYSVSPLALILIIIGTVCALRLAWLRCPPRAATSGRPLIAGLIVVLFCLPLLVNWYEPSWNALLKSLPFLGNSSNLLRWFCLYTMVAAVAAGLGSEAILRYFDAGARMRWASMAVAFLALFAWQLSIDRHQNEAFAAYIPTKIQTAYGQARDGTIPDITALSAYTNAAGDVMLPTSRNDVLTAGQSQLACYQPLFGYWLEAFPLGKLQLGPMMQSMGGILNVKNPACYLFPEVNNCRPGDHFLLSERSSAQNLLTYRPISFVLPGYIAVAEWVSSATLALLLLALLIGGLRCGLRRVNPAV